MNVRDIFLKEARGEPVRRAATLQAQAGYGIIQDVHARPESPRQILLASSGSLAQHSLLPGDLDETITVDGDVDKLSSGVVVRVGASALVRITFACTPCAKLDRIRPGLAKELQGCRGVLGRVVGGGQICRGDSLTLTDQRYRPLSPLPRQRLWDVVSRIPPGKVATYAMLIVAIGVPKDYVRALPRVLLRGPESLPVHRVVDTRARPITHHIPDQLKRLAEEGTQLKEDGRFEASALWSSALTFSDEKPSD